MPYHRDNSPMNGILIVPTRSQIRPKTSVVGQSGLHSHRARAMTLVEVMFASVILTMVVLGVLQGSLQSRRMTEGSVRQAAVASLVQGYLEQIKSIKYGDLTVSPSVTPGTGLVTDWNSINLVVLKDSNQANTTICLAAGTAPASLPVISTLPTDASLHTEAVDIDNVNSGTDNTTLSMWIWVNDMTGSNVVNCKSIIIVYQWTVRDGGRIRAYSDMMRTVRSAVPTD